MDFRYPQGMRYPQKYYHSYHNRPPGRIHEKEFELLSSTKINVTKVGTEKEDEKMESVFHTSLDFFLTFFDKCFG